MFAGHQQPSLKFLNRYVRGSVGTKWYDLGIELLDYYFVEELDTIEAEHPLDLNKCCTKMFQLWLKNQPTASWNQLIEALTQPGIELGTLASNCEQMLLQPGSRGSFILVMRSLLHSYTFLLTFLYVNTYKCSISQFVILVKYCNKLPAPVM